MLRQNFLQRDDDKISTKRLCSDSFGPIFTFVLTLIYFSLMQVYTKDHYVFRQAFIEQNPELSYPYVTSQVSNNALGGFSVAVLQIGLIVANVICIIHEKNKKNTQL